MAVLLAPNSSRLLSRKLDRRAHHEREQQQQQGGAASSSISLCGASSTGLCAGSGRTGRKNEPGRRAVEARAFWQDVSRPASVEMVPINDIEQFDEILRLSEDDPCGSFVVDWMATWCRKCIFLKPKLEKLSVEFPQVKFYCVNVNTVSQALVKRGNISKMPTIQLWKAGEMKEEIIGGHKAWQVVEEVREMIKKYL